MILSNNFKVERNVTETRRNNHTFSTNSTTDRTMHDWL